MDDSQRKQFTDCIGALCASFGTDASTALYNSYWLGLADIELSSVQSAVARAIRECSHLPRPAELRKLSGEQSGETRSMAAWNDVQRALPIGPYKHIDFQDKIINAVVRNLGGWPNFVGRFTDADSEKWVRIEFIKCYEAFAFSGGNGEMCAPLAGMSMISGSNGVVGNPIPRLIACDPSRAKEPLRIANPHQ
jgi:hypothetical protein